MVTLGLAAALLTHSWKLLKKFFLGELPFLLAHSKCLPATGADLHPGSTELILVTAESIWSQV